MCVNNNISFNKFVISGSQMTLNVPILIMELYRLVPYKEGRYVHFHPFNMPNIKVRKIELVGIVTNVKRDVNNLSLTSKARGMINDRFNNKKICINFSNLIAVEDGTGVVKINYKLEQYLFSLKQRHEIDKKYRNQAENLRETKVVQNCPKKFPETRPGFSYPCNTSLEDIAVSLRTIIYIIIIASNQITSFHVVNSFVQFSYFYFYIVDY